ncbi:MAG: GNAT family N-acetyltransferase [Planctomycetes bacterium]|nr:GNAT family N-acetyltransferase [Planctomycetota bacterium]
MLQPISASLLEHAVFSKMHFDRKGLIVATQDEIPIGFVHAGFGPNEQCTALDTSLGTTCMLMLRGGQEDLGLADRLLAASEDYLRGRGASVLYAGGIQPMNSFYLGLYGGSEIPGILDSNSLLRETCLERGYRETSQIPILQTDLKTFRPSLSRKVRQLRQQTEIVETIDPVSTTWWEACVWGAMQRDLFQLVDRSQDRVVATASFWDIQPLSTSWGVCTAGLFDLYVEPDWRRRGAANYLLSEAFRKLHSRGVSAIEVQTMATNEAALALYGQLGFAEIDRGKVFRKA